ncbi:hypothetical protein [Azospirillum argentinense]
MPVAPRPAPAPANVQKKKAKSFSFTAYGHEAIKAALHALFDGKCEMVPVSRTDLRLC